MNILQKKNYHGDCNYKNIELIYKNLVFLFQKKAQLYFLNYYSFIL